MERQLLLISSPGKPEDNYYAPFVKDTVNRFKCFFQSSVGGGWKDNEIEEFGEGIPLTESMLDELIARMDGMAYSFIFFCGHGGMENGVSKILLPDSKGTIYPVNKLKSEGKGDVKRTVLVDACRSRIQTLITEAESVKQEYTVHYAPESVELYKEGVKNTSPHVELYQSTGPYEYANASNQYGPYYSELLLREIDESFSHFMMCANAMGNKVVSLNELHERVCEKIKVKAGSHFPQHPTAEGVDGDLFPFLTISRTRRV